MTSAVIDRTTYTAMTDKNKLDLTTMSLVGSGPRSRIGHFIAIGCLDSALRAIRGSVEEVFCEPLNTAEIFGDAGLDSACQEIGKASLARLGPAPAVISSETPVFIASRLQRSGGHTAVLADIARHIGKGATVLLTGVAGRTRLDELTHIFRDIDPLRFEIAPPGSLVGKLVWLQGRLKGLAPETVWLVNHHADSVAVAAVQPNQGYTLKYLHHGDHHLCLGVMLSFGEHYDPHAMGFHNCRDVLHRSNNRYLPMAVQPLNCDHDSQVVAASKAPLLTCTVAGKNKIEHVYWPSYADVVAQLLANTESQHVHIGPLSKVYRWRIRRNLARNGVDQARFLYIPFVPNVSQALSELGIDVYLSSFPYAGARTLVEVMAAGIPIAAHDHNGSRFLSAMDMLPEGSFVWSRAQELVSFVQSAGRSDLQSRGQKALAHYQRFHTPEAMRAALICDNAIAEPPKSSYVHQPDPLAQAIYRARQVTIAGAVGRLMCRWARRVRSSIS